MAIYHFDAKIVKREEGRSSVAASAYRSGSKLLDESTGIVHDYTRKLGVEHTEILAPDHAPLWMHDRSRLWNAVERQERRCDSQLARDIEVGLPVELSKNEQVALLRDYIQRTFVAQGMVADLGLHLDNPHNPHAHVLLTMRHIEGEGFGLKNTAWNQTSALLGWRQAWAEVSNEHLAQAGLAIRIDHRSYRDQGLELIPGRKIGVGQSRQADEKLPGYLADRVAEQRAIAAANGVQILADPGIALKALTQQQATFTYQEVAKFLHTRTDNAEQFQAAFLKVTTAPEMVGLGLDDQGRQRFTTRQMLGHEKALFADAQMLAQRAGHGVDPELQRSVLSQRRLSADQRAAFEQVTQCGDLKSLVGVAGSGKSTTLSAMREAWEAQGFHVKGAAVAGLAAQNLTQAAGIEARTLASFELAWAGGRDGLSQRDVLVIDEAGMIPTRQLKSVLEVARQAGAKVVLVGDPEQLQAIEAGAPFRGIAAQADHDAACPYQWDHEETIYRARVPSSFPRGLTIPRLLSAEVNRDQIHLFLEDLTLSESVPISLDELPKLAKLLGLWHGTARSGDIARAGWLKWYVEAASASVKSIPMLASTVEALTVLDDGDVHADVDAFWARRAAVFEILESLPQVNSHQDLVARNIFVRDLIDGTREHVLIDWALYGSAPVGAELAPLLFGSALLFAWTADEAKTALPAVVDAYLSGLNAANVSSSREDVCTGLMLTAALRYIAWGGHRVDAALDISRHAWAESTVGRKLTDIVKRFAEIRKVVLAMGILALSKREATACT